MKSVYYLVYIRIDITNVLYKYSRQSYFLPTEHYLTVLMRARACIYIIRPQIMTGNKLVRTWWMLVTLSARTHYTDIVPRVSVMNRPQRCTVTPIFSSAAFVTLMSLLVLRGFHEVVLFNFHWRNYLSRLLVGEKSIQRFVHGLNLCKTFAGLFKSSEISNIFGVYPATTHVMVTETTEIGVKVWYSWNMSYTCSTQNQLTLDMCKCVEHISELNRLDPWYPGMGHWERVVDSTS
jgi:hypothetical protein